MLRFLLPLSAEIPDCVAGPSGAKKRHGCCPAPLRLWEQRPGAPLPARAGGRPSAEDRAAHAPGGFAAGGRRAQDDGTERAAGLGAGEAACSGRET